MSNGKFTFAIQPPEWLREVKDDNVAGSVFGLIVSHNISGEPFTEKGLKKEISDFDDLTKEQKQEVFDLIVSHKDK